MAGLERLRLALAQSQQPARKRRLALQPHQRLGADQVARRSEQRMPTLDCAHGNAVDLLDRAQEHLRLDQLDSGNMERCPGAATQIAPDGSNANTDELLPEGGCKPDQNPEGP